MVSKRFDRRSTNAGEERAPMVRAWRLTGTGAAAVLAAALATVLAAGTAYAAAWSSSDRWGTWSNGGYTIYNDVWGGGAGPQSIWANSYSNWGVSSDQPNTGGVKSYPNAAAGRATTRTRSCSG
jgi:hypothetical protein